LPWRIERWLGPLKTFKLEVQTMKRREELKSMLEEMMKAVEEMPPGGDLEKLFEEKMAGVKTKAFEQAIERRREVAERGDFSPSGV
jgi:hypothetical protein